ncbi:pentapeptide repeat-containing protein [Mycobacterium intermedium]|uniref:pentapeptide repeat-containing protein n=1 Tax=Mycobacterium intermedium TaxID=28445 RepID=UPI003FD6E413
MNTGSFNAGNINTGFANVGDINTGSFNTGDRNFGAFNLGSGQGADGTHIAVEFPAIPIDLVFGTNVAIPVTGYIYPITIYAPPTFGIPVNVSVTVLLTINVSGTLLSPGMDNIVVNPIVFNDLTAGADLRIPFQMNLLGRLNLGIPGLSGFGNSNGTSSSGFFNGSSNNTSGFFNSNDWSSGLANANGAWTSGWYNSGTLLSGFQNLGNAISGIANTSTLGADTAALISGIGNVGSQISGYWNGQVSALQAALAALSPINGGLVVTTT